MEKTRTQKTKTQDKPKDLILMMTQNIFSILVTLLAIMFVVMVVMHKLGYMQFAFLYQAMGTNPEELIHPETFCNTLCLKSSYDYGFSEQGTNWIHYSKVRDCMCVHETGQGTLITKIPTRLHIQDSNK